MLACHSRGTLAHTFVQHSGPMHACVCGSPDEHFHLLVPTNMPCTACACGTAVHRAARGAGTNTQVRVPPAFVRASAPNKSRCPHTAR